MEITPYDNFDRYNDEFNRKVGKIFLTGFGITVLIGISVFAYYRYIKKKRQDK
jgi:hypothetical protein